MEVSLLFNFERRKFLYSFINLPPQLMKTKHSAFKSRTSETSFRLVLPKKSQISETPIGNLSRKALRFTSLHFKQCPESVRISYGAQQLNIRNLNQAILLDTKQPDRTYYPSLQLNSPSGFRPNSPRRPTPKHWKPRSGVSARDIATGHTSVR